MKSTLFLGVLAAVSLAVACPVAVAAAETLATTAALTLAPGESTTVSLEENVTTGYAWRYDPAASTDPACVTIADLGHERRHADPMVGASGLHRWRLTGVARGRAELRFTYQRPWEPKPVQQHTVTVEVR